MHTQPHSCCGKWPLQIEERTPQELYQAVLNSSINTTYRHGEGQYCTQAVLKDIRNNMGPSIVVTNDGVSFLYPRKKTSMQSSVKMDLASGTTIALKQTYKENNKLKNLARLLRGLRSGFEITSRPSTGVSNFCCIFSVEITQVFDACAQELLLIWKALRSKVLKTVQRLIVL